MHVDAEKENKFEKVYGKQFWLSGPDLLHSEFLLLQLSLTAKTARNCFQLACIYKPPNTGDTKKNVGMVVKWVMHFDFSCPGWSPLACNPGPDPQLLERSQSFAGVQTVQRRLMTEGQQWGPLPNPVTIIRTAPEGRAQEKDISHWDHGCLLFGGMTLCTGWESKDDGEGVFLLLTLWEVSSDFK